MSGAIPPLTLYVFTKWSETTYLCLDTSNVEFSRQSLQLTLKDGYDLKLYIHMPSDRDNLRVHFASNATLHGDFVIVRNKLFFSSPQLSPHVLMNFRGFSPGYGDSLADF